VLKDWSVYQVKKMLLCFMVKQAAEKLKSEPDEQE
jgi:hypothetical protein